MLCGEPTCLSFLPLMHSTDIDLPPPPSPPSVLSVFISTIGTLSLIGKKIFLYTLNIVVRPPSLVLVYLSSSSTLTGSNIVLTCSITLEEDTVDGVTVEVVWTGPTGSSLTDGTTPTGTGSSYTSTLPLSSVTVSDAGPYTCTASLTSSLPFLLSSDTNSGSTTVTVQSKLQDYL